MPERDVQLPCFNSVWSYCWTCSILLVHMRRIRCGQICTNFLCFNYSFSNSSTSKKTQKILQINLMTLKEGCTSMVFFVLFKNFKCSRQLGHYIVILSQFFVYYVSIYTKICSARWKVYDVGRGGVILNLVIIGGTCPTLTFKLLEGFFSFFSFYSDLLISSSSGHSCLSTQHITSVFGDQSSIEAKKF